MMDDLDLHERPDAAQLAAARAAIIAFREQHKTLGTAALAIAFIEQHGCATSTELSVLLDLGADRYPSVELRSSVQGERLVCNGRIWTLGPKAIPSTREQGRAADHETQSLPQNPALQSSPALEVPTFVPATKTGGPIPATKPGAVPGPIHTLAKPSRCRFAIWSDEKVEIKVPGNPSLELTLAEVDELIRFVAKTTPRHPT